jgi:LmbE family N-acetylglucosaminyl deacetylase
LHLYLSPHFDDAALSCGGHIAQLCQNGERVVVFTVMAGDPPVGFKPTPFTEKLHQDWGLQCPPLEGRGLEDEKAMSILGAEVKFGPYPDAVYRIDPKTGGALYPDRDSIFAKVQPGDPVLQAKRAAVVQALIALFDIKTGDTIHVPLGVGQHVDHQIVREMGKALMRWRPSNPMFFYEDYPYLRQGQAAIRSAVEELGLEVARVTHALDPVTIDKRIAAIACYRSQLASLEWPTTVAMSTEVRTSIAQIGGEREWRLLYVPDSPLN